MCGRFTLRTSPRAVADAFGLIATPEFSPRYNLAPTQLAPVVRQPGEGGRQLEFFRWGLVPAWAKDLSIGNRMINARSETAAEKPAFRKALSSRRCLVVADGFFEWQKQPSGGKQAFYMTAPDDRPFAFAGLWELWSRGEQPVFTCTILTTSANSVMAPLHDRMPVIIGETDYDRWLDVESGQADRIADLLRPAADTAINLRPVGKLVNSPWNDSPECIQLRGSQTDEVDLKRPESGRAAGSPKFTPRNLF